MPYLVHGIRVEGPVVLEGEPESALGGAANVLLRPQAGLREPPGPPAWTSPVTGYRLHRDESGYWLANDAGRFLLGPDEILVDPVPLDPVRTEYLVNNVLAMWLQLVGRPALHAAAVSVGGRAVGLLARSGTGKSTLASALVARGARLLCDDLLPVHFEGSELRVWIGRGYMKLWPDSARRLTEDVDGLRRVLPTSEKRRVIPPSGGASSEVPPSFPLRVIYVVDRTDGQTRDVTIDAVPETEALLALLAHGQMAGVSELTEAAPRRLEALARVVREIPVRRVRYPSGFEVLPDVCATIENDVRA